MKEIYERVAQELSSLDVASIHQMHERHQDPAPPEEIYPLISEFIVRSGVEYPVRTNDEQDTDIETNRSRNRALRAEIVALGYTGFLVVIHEGVVTIVAIHEDDVNISFPHTKTL